MNATLPQLGLAAALWVGAAPFAVVAAAAPVQAPTRLAQDPPAVTGLAIAQVDPLQDGAAGELRDAEGFLRAGPGRPLSFPVDHGSHPDTRTEWWYLTGSLEGGAGETFGFQATWFRRALLRAALPQRSPLAVRDVLLFHGVVADVDTQTVWFTEQASRAYPPWARARVDTLDVAVLRHRLTALDPQVQTVSLSMEAGGAQLELELDWGAAKPLLHGERPGLSIKGHELGQASWYYSLPDIRARGQLRRPGEQPVAVQGTVWFDHEFGSGQLGPEQVGWDWFSVVLDDGTQLMLYRMRLATGEQDTTSSGTIRMPAGRRVHLGPDDFQIQTDDHWTSSRTDVRYPAAWKLDLPGQQLRLRVTPVLSDQELLTPGTTGVNYWEGLCHFEGERSGQPVRGRGYVELVGHGEPVADRFRAARESNRP
jgi:predicted secreted hydrolase